MDEEGYQKGMKRLGRMAVQNAPMEKAGEEMRSNQCKLCGYVWKTGMDDDVPRVCPECKTSLWNRKGARKVKCKRCGHTWATTTKAPAMCPSCKSRRWKSATLTIVCKRCGSSWDDTLKKGDIVSCPACGVLFKDEYSVCKPRKVSLKNVTDPKRKKTVPLTEKTLRDMWKEENSMYKAVLLRKCGLSQEQADIIARFDSGEYVPEIAVDMRIPLSRVMDSVIPYMELCEYLGVRSWN